MKTVSFLLCAWFTLMTSFWRAVTFHFENMSLVVFTICTNGRSGRHDCSDSVVHKSLMPTIINTLRHWGGSKVSFEEYVKEIAIIDLPSHRRRDKKSKIHTARTFSTSTSSLEWSVALVGYAICTTVAGTSVAVDGTNTSCHSGHIF